MDNFGKDGTKQRKSLIFIVASQVEQFPKVQEKKRTVVGGVGGVRCY